MFEVLFDPISTWRKIDACVDKVWSAGTDLTPKEIISKCMTVGCCMYVFHPIFYRMIVLPNLRTV